MVTLLDALKTQIRQTFCSGLADTEQFLSNLQGVASQPLLALAANRLNALVCNRPTDEIELPPPPFEGGQCPGVLYRIITSRDVGANGQPVSSERGPAPGPFSIDRTQGAAPPEGCGSGQSSGPIWGTLVAGDGQLFGLGDQCQNAPATPLKLDLIRADGQPDECGDPDPELPPPGPIHAPVTVVYGDNNEFNLTIPVIFGVAYVSIDGSVEIPITIEDLDLVGELALNGEFEINLDFGGNRPLNTGDDGPDGEPDPDGGDPEDEAEEELGNIIGVFVVVTSLPTERATFIPQSRGPSIIAPRAASVKFKMSANDRSGWTEDFPVKNSNAWIPVPGRLLAEDVQVTPDFGATVAFAVVRETPRP